MSTCNRFLSETQGQLPKHDLDSWIYTNRKSPLKADAARCPRSVPTFSFCVGAFLLGEKQAHHVLGILFWVVQWWFYYYYYFFNPWNGQSPFSGLKVIWIFLSLLMLAQHVWEVHRESRVDSVFRAKFMEVMPFLSPLSSPRLS